MSYSEFTLNDIHEKFGLLIEEQADMFSEVKQTEVSTLLRQILDENVPLALAIATEKARSEMIIAPVLIEVRKLFDRRISLFSGIEFNVDKERGLNGVCDYIISLSKEQLYLRSPVLSIVEAKNEDMKSGMAQCAAEMIAAQIFNEKRASKIGSVYGVVTTGSAWRFMKLDQRLHIDLVEYYIGQLGKILGIFSFIISAELERVSN
jgi:hypothetical protein